MSYRSEDVQQILQRALTRQQEEYSRQQLLEMAAELGITPDVLQQAEQEWLCQRDEFHLRRSFNKQLRCTFRAHLVPYLGVNTFLILLNLLATPRFFWSVYLLLGWGLGLFLHGWYAHQTEGPAYEQEFQKWCKRQRKIRDRIRENQDYSL